MTNLNKNPNILKLANVYKLKVAKYMHNNKLRKSLYDDYVKIKRTTTIQDRCEIRSIVNLELTNL